MMRWAHAGMEAKIAILSGGMDETARVHRGTRRRGGVAERRRAQQALPVIGYVSNRSAHPRRHFFRRLVGG